MVDPLPVALTLQNSQPHSLYFGQPPGRLLSWKARPRRSAPNLAHPPIVLPHWLRLPAGLHIVLPRLPNPQPTGSSSEPRGGAFAFTRWIRAQPPTCTDQAKLAQNPCLLPVARRLRHSRTCWPHPGGAPASSGERQARSHQAGLSDRYPQISLTQQSATTALPPPPDDRNGNITPTNTPLPAQPLSPVHLTALDLLPFKDFAWSSSPWAIRKKAGHVCAVALMFGALRSMAAPVSHSSA